MFNGLNTNIYSTVIIFCVFVLTSIIVYHLNDRIKHLEVSVSKQNQVLSDFISNVQNRIVSSPSLGIEKKSTENNKIIVSDDESDSGDDCDYDDSDSDSDSQSESDNDSDSEDDNDNTEENKNNNIKIIELNHIENQVENNLKKITEISDINEITEVLDSDDNTDNEMNTNKEHPSTPVLSQDNIKKIDLDLLEKEDLNDEDSILDANKMKKMTVAELRSLVVLKGLAKHDDANKMKKPQLVEALLIV